MHLAIWQGDIEHVNFVIARRNCAVGCKNQRAIDSRVIFIGQKLRPGQHPHTQRAPAQRKPPLAGFFAR